MDSGTITQLLNWGVPVVLIVIAFFTGSIFERRHFSRLAEKEDALRDILVFPLRHVPSDLDLSDPRLVGGSVVVSTDYFKSFAAYLRGIVGGRIGTYETLLERARREAVVRMKEDAREHNRGTILNVKFETLRITAGVFGSVYSVEAFAYGTAYR